MTPVTRLGGTWLGGFDRPGGWRFIQLQFGSDGEATATDLVVVDDHLSFKLRSVNEVLLFDGERAGETITGSIATADGRGAAALLRTQPVEESTAVVGTYAIGGGSRVAVFSFLGLPLPGSLAMLEATAGRRN